MTANVIECEFAENFIAQSNCPRFLFGAGDGPTIHQHAADHPKSADAIPRVAVDKYGTIFRSGENFQEFIGLLVARMLQVNRNQEIAKAESLGLSRFPRGIEFLRAAEVENRADALRFLQAREIARGRLAAGAELRILTQEILDAGKIGGLIPEAGALQKKSREKEPGKTRDGHDY